QRMRLYVAAFGLSTDRLYATAFMILLLGVLAWFAWTVLRGQRQKFVFGSLMQGLAVLAGLHVLNPDAFLITTNLNRPAAERPFDAQYALTLGAGAVPSSLAAVRLFGGGHQIGAAAKWPGPPDCHRQGALRRADSLGAPLADGAAHAQQPLCRPGGRAGASVPRLHRPTAPPAHSRRVVRDRHRVR